jgi:hypothetical protein
MKKNKFLLIILIVLIAAVLYFLFTKSQSSIRKELSDFAVKDTASISKIFLADRSGESVTLNKTENGNWLVNNKYQPNREFLKLLFDAIYKIEVRTRVSKSGYNNVIKNLASSGIKCEIYLNNKSDPEKVYYVGGQTEDALGTFMILENSNVPFITEIPGFNGYLTPRYSVKIDSWRKPALFQIMPDQIKSLQIDYTNYPEKSFQITKGDRYIVESPHTKTRIKNVDEVAIENYLPHYKNVYFETWARNIKQQKIDSIMNYKPSITIKLTDKNDSTRQIDIYPMPISPGSLAQHDSLGNPLKYDNDRMYGMIKPENEFVVIQHFTFDKLFRQIEDFDAKK